MTGSYANGFAPRDGQPLYPELWKGCVGAWAPCLGPTGLTLRDCSGYGNHGTLTNMVANDDWLLKGGRYSLDFDGANDVVTMGAWRPLSTTSQFTFMASIHLTFLSGDRYPVVASFRTNTGMFSFAISNAGSYLGMLMGSQNAAWGRFANGLAATTWSVARHVAYTYNGQGATTVGNFSTYLDGVRYSVSATPAFAGQVDESQFGGDGNGTSFFSGALFSASLHNIVLPEKTIRLAASNCGIAYQLAPRRKSRIFTGGFKAYWAARKAQIIGGGL